MFEKFLKTLDIQHIPTSIAKTPDIETSILS